MATHSSILAWRIPGTAGAWWAAVYGVAQSRTPIPKKGNAKECSNYCTTALISHASKVMLKILQASEVPDVQAGFRKGRGTRDQIANIH